MLYIRTRDINRATLPRRCGNEGWIGISPAGDRYHVVVPVDAQIAKGVMACNWPTDGTPFGGYTGWLYFRCEPYDDEIVEDKIAHKEQVRRNLEELAKFTELYGMQCEIIDDSVGKQPAMNVGAMLDEDGPQPVIFPAPVARCGTCGRQWHKINELLRDTSVKLMGYRVCPEDFSRGSLVFSHGCPDPFYVPIRNFGRTRAVGKSLIGSHACPGLCHYETSLQSCSATCDGATYRRIAARLKSRSKS